MHIIPFSCAHACVRVCARVHACVLHYVISVVNNGESTMTQNSQQRRDCDEAAGAQLHVSFGWNIDFLFAQHVLHAVLWCSMKPCSSMSMFSKQGVQAR